jgi:uncharacterized GH25 family protein
MSISTPRSILIALVLIALAGAADAHNTWLVVDARTAAPGAPVRVALSTAHHRFPGSENATEPERVARAVVFDGRTTRELSGWRVERKDLAATFTPAGPGVQTIGLELHPRFIELSADSFNRYLEEESAREALAHRRDNGTSDRPGRELYTKLTKCFVEVPGGGASESAFATPLGHTLELVPRSNPCRWNQGDAVEVLVLFEGEPAEGVIVSAGHESLGGHEYAASAATDDAGVARLTLDRPGHWFLRAHTIQPIESPGADWESFWASLTFHADPAGDR